MLFTVLWHRDRAAAAYLEIEYDPQPWNDYAARYALQNKLLLSPLLPLIAFRLVEFATANPRINATGTTRSTSGSPSKPDRPSTSLLCKARRR